MNELNIKSIMDYLPHRYPFLLVDKVISYESGKSIEGIKNVTANEPFFQGHFPNLPIMPGVLIIEALAQISGLLLFLTTDTKPTDDNWCFFAGIDKARFKNVVRPGDQLLMHSEVIRNRLDIWMLNAQAKVNGALACSVELMLAKGAVK